MLLRLSVPLLLLCSGASLQAQEEAVASRIESVTLYRDQALVTRVVEIKPGNEAKPIIVSGLPETLVVDSVYAEGDGNASIRAVRISTRQEAESGREEVRKLEDAIKQNQLAQELATSDLNVLTQNIQSLTEMINFTSATSRGDLNSGVLQAETLVELVNFSMTKRAELALKQVEKQRKLRELQETASLLARSLQTLTASGIKVAYDAKIFVELAKPEAATIRLSYLVRNCGWSPQYTVRGELEKPSLTLRYSAMVQQMSGEDWSDIRLTLSTASPTVNAGGPTLTPYRVQCSPAQEAFAIDAPGDSSMSSYGASGSIDKLSGAMKSLRSQQQTAESQLYGDNKSNSPAMRDQALNRLALQMQQIELSAVAKDANKIDQDSLVEVASQIYELSAPVSLESRRDQQLVQITESVLDAEMYHVATPLLSSYAYREAVAINEQSIGLLRGPVSVYLDGRFVGQSVLPSTASGQRFVVGFGADQQVRTRRELRRKEDEVQGGNRRLTFQYRLVISNFKDNDVKVRLLDRIPVTDQQQQISVNLVDPGRPLSDDAIYNRVQRSFGILRWDIEVPKGANGANSLDVEYTYTVEFDRNNQLSSVDVDATANSEMMDNNYNGGMGGGMGGR